MLSRTAAQTILQPIVLLNRLLTRKSPNSDLITLANRERTYRNLKQLPDLSSKVSAWERKQPKNKQTKFSPLILVLPEQKSNSLYKMKVQRGLETHTLGSQGTHFTTSSTKRFHDITRTISYTRNVFKTLEFSEILNTTAKFLS